MINLGLPVLASEHGAHVDSLILWVHYLMGVLFVGWFGYFVYVISRFRQSKNPKASYLGAQTHVSTWIEGGVAVVEVFLLVGLSVPLWAKWADKFPDAKENPTLIRIVAEQFAWHAYYPGADGVFGKQSLSLVNSTNQIGRDFSDPTSKDDFEANLNEIVVPVDKPLIAYITSKDVIHSFKVNPMRITQDAMPGLSIPIWFKPTREGEYLINCAQLCGGSHYNMKGFFKVLSQEKYKDWFADKVLQAKGPAPAGSFE